VTTTDPKVGSLDVESYGIAERNAKGELLPPQTLFHPVRSLMTDLVKRSDLVLTVSLTLPEFDPRPVGEADWNGERLASLVPGDTFLYDMWVPAHVHMLAQHLAYVDTLIGKDISFDIPMLRFMSPILANILNGKRHTLIDLSIINFLHYELRPEKSLKDIGPLSGLFKYDRSLRDGGDRYPFPDEDEHLYNAEDTHNTMLGTAHYAGCIARDYSPFTPPPNYVSPLGISGPSADVKLCPYAIRYFSDRLWGLIRMKEAGIPMSVWALRKLERDLIRDCEEARTFCAAHGLILHGEGSDGSKRSYLLAAYAEADSLVDSDGVRRVERILGVESILSHEVVQFTKEKKELSVKLINIQLVRLILPESHPMRPVLDAWERHTKAQKIVSSYTYPLLRYRKVKTSKKGNLKDTILLRPPHLNLPPGIAIAYPNVYIVPTNVKDDAGSAGGQRQVRPSFKAPNAQTFPPLVKACEISRFGAAGRICSFDLSQIELRVAALESGDEVLFNEYIRAKPDLHGQRAIDIYGPSVVNHPHWKSGEMDKDPRQWGKKFNFMDLFLAGASKMQASMLEDSGVLFPISFFKDVVAQRPQIRWGLLAWQQAVMQEATLRNHLILPFIGVSRTFIGGGVTNKINELVNFPIQGIAAAILGRIQHYVTERLPSLNDRNPPVYMFLDVYDATYFDCRLSYVDTLRTIVQEAVSHVEKQELWSWLQDLFGREIPLTYEFKVHDPPEHHTPANAPPSPARSDGASVEAAA